MRKWIKKCTAGAAALVTLASVLTACEGYNPQISGADNASGAAVSGAVVAGQQDKELPKKEKMENSETAGLKYNTDGEYFDWINVNIHSAKNFYVANCFKGEGYWHIDQIPSGCDKIKETGIESMEPIRIIGIRGDRLFYENAGKIYRVPIVPKKNSELLDSKKKECMIKNCASNCSLMDGQRLYYMTEGKTELSQDAAREELQIHCMDLETGKERLCSEKILVVEDREDYEGYEEEEFVIYPEYNVTEDYIYYSNFTQESGNSYADYLYQLDKRTMELSVIDALDLCDDYYDCEMESSYEMAEDGTYIWYIKATGGTKDRNCEHEICRYDVKKQQKSVVGTEAGCQDLICKERKIDAALVNDLCLEIVYSDDDKVYIEYEIGYVGEKLRQEYRSGVIVYSLSADKWEPLDELSSFYNKHLSEEWDEDESGKKVFLYRESVVEVAGVWEKKQKFLLWVDNYDEKTDSYSDMYALYDIKTGKVVNISEKKGDKIEELIWKEQK